MGFTRREYPINTAYDVVFRSGYTIDLAKAVINVLPPILRDILDALDFDKWLRLRHIAEMEIKFRLGGFAVNILKNTFVLIHSVRDEAGARKVVDALKAVYVDEFAEDIHVNRHCHGKRLAVKIPARLSEKYKDIKKQVIEVLCRKLKKAKDERKKREIAKQLTRLTTPTEGAAAVYSINL